MNIFWILNYGVAMHVANLLNLLIIINLYFSFITGIELIDTSLLKASYNLSAPFVSDKFIIFADLSGLSCAARFIFFLCI